MKHAVLAAVLCGLAVLMAVLVGVAPRLVLPADWPLRRTEDASTVDAPGQLPVWTPSPDSCFNPAGRPVSASSSAAAPPVTIGPLP